MGERPKGKRDSDLDNAVEWFPFEKSGEKNKPNQKHHHVLTLLTNPGGVLKLRLGLPPGTAPLLSGVSMELPA